MRRILVLAAMALMVATAAMAQKVYGDRPGWTVYTSEDEYSGKKSHCLRYYDQQRALAASFWPGINRMAVLEWYDGVLFMDETLEAVTERHGEFPDREVDYEWRVALPKNDSAEDFGTVKMTFGDVERVADTFFGTFVFDADGDAMKAGWASVKLALAGFILPYMFVYNNSLLLIGQKMNEKGKMEIVRTGFASGAMTAVFSVIGVALLSIAVEGHLFSKVNPVLRALAIIGAFLLMTPNMMFNLVGIGIAAAVIVIQKAAGGRVNAAAA